LMPAHAQETELSSVDQRKRDAMVEKLQLTPDQIAKVDSVFQTFSGRLSDFDLQIKEVQRDTSFTEKELSIRLVVLRQNQKDERSLRELDLKNVLSEEQLVVYEKDIQPSKPKVLHFGIHNRADCKVCVK
ncbi:MAG: hypothetical protein ACPGED_04070, partial [Flavobacteriales bacterium]